MSTHNPTASRNPDIVESVDTTDFQQPHLVIADISLDNAWIAMPEHISPSLENWR